MTKTSNELSMNFSSEIGLKDFSFSQLIVAVKSLFDTKGVPEFIRALVILIEIILIKSGVVCPPAAVTKAINMARPIRP